MCIAFTNNLPIGGQSIDLALTRNISLRLLNLGDKDNSSNKNIDLLIGADYYWKIANVETKKIDIMGYFQLVQN